MTQSNGKWAFPDAIYFRGICSQDCDIHYEPKLLEVAPKIHISSNYNHRVFCMYSYLIDELSPKEIERLIHYLDYHGYQGPIKDIYWFEIPNHLLNATQQNHLQTCGPYILSLETGKTWIKLELLVRPRNTVRCTCSALATPEQRSYGMNLLDHILMDLGLVQ